MTNGQGKTTVINILMKNYCFSKCVFVHPADVWLFVVVFFLTETYHLFFFLSASLSYAQHIVLHRRPANTRATLQSRYILCTISLAFYVSHLYVLNFALYRRISIAITRT